MTTYPYDGLKVLDLSRILAGPWIGQTLADMGADVVKIEAPGGDDTRRWGPPFIEREGETTAAYYFSCNRGKRSIVANLKDADDLAAVQALAAQADVIIQNYKKGGLDKFALDYPSVSKTNPGVVYASITGFGQDGPRASQPGYDLLIQGMSGIMDITGPADREPQKMGVAFADIFTGIYGVIGIQAALKMRAETGRGQEVDLALFDTLSAVLANQGLNFMVSGQSPKRNGNRHPNLVPYETYQCSDGHMIIATGNDRQFQLLCDVLGIPEVAASPDFENNAARVSNLDEMAEVLNKATGAFTRQDLIARLTEVGVPAGPINTIEEAHADPQFQHRAIRVDPEGVPGLRTPLKFSDASLKVEKAAPSLGNTNFSDIEW